MATTNFRFFNLDMTADEAKKELRQLARQNHPDLGGDAELMTQINQEYAEFVRVKENGGITVEGVVNPADWTPEALWEALRKAAYEDALTKQIWTDGAGIFVVHIPSVGDSRVEIRIGSVEGATEYREPAPMEVLTPGQRKGVIARATEIAHGAVQQALFW